MRKVISLVTKVLPKMLPVLGDAIENKQSKDGGEGKFQWGKFFLQVLRIGGTVATTLLFK